VTHISRGLLRGRAAHRWVIPTNKPHKEHTMYNLVLSALKLWCTFKEIALLAALRDGAGVLPIGEGLAPGNISVMLVPPVHPAHSRHCRYAANRSLLCLVL